MYKINRIKIGGFRRLYDVDIQVKPLMVLIGANGVGKTSLLDAISVLSASATGGLSSELSSLGGVTSVLTRRQTQEVSLRVDMDVVGYQPLEYEVHLAPKGGGYAIASETLVQSREGYDVPFKHIDSRGDEIRYYPTEGGRKGLVRPSWEHSPLETSLAQVPKMFRQPEELRRILGSATRYHALDVSPRAPVKLPQQMKPAELPGADGEDLVSYLYYMREGTPSCFDAIVDSLRAAFCDFECLNFPPVAAGMLTMTWKDKNFSKPPAA